MEQSGHTGHVNHGAGHAAAGYGLRIDNGHFSAGEPGHFAFTVQDEHGHQLREFLVSHEKLMHLIIVSRDLSHFQHLHPVFDPAEGRFSISGLKFPHAGRYEVFADFATTASDGIKASGLARAAMHVSGTPAADVPLGPPNDECSVSGSYTVRLLNMEQLRADEDVMLRFVVEQSGQPVYDLENYLGEKGHAVILSAPGLDFIHAHPAHEQAPQPGLITYHLRFPVPGSYKAFVQFQHQGVVQTANFVLHVHEAAH